ncbi:hypothetical protein [Duffyella gerundensis]|uniref:hypothetical protein n=1 Tax=Duffyella TaxID=3026546 RepID=UPI003F6DD92D
MKNKFMYQTVQSVSAGNQLARLVIKKVTQAVAKQEANIPQTHRKFPTHEQTELLMPHQPCLIASLPFTIVYI